MNSKVFLILALAICASCNDIDDYIEGQMDKAHIPSLTAVVVSGDQVLWQSSYGYSNDTTLARVTTPYMLASISKTAMSVTLMTLYDQGLFKLDDDINDYLNFSVVNPHYPKLPITFRQLMAHTSTINDEGYGAHDNLYYTVGDSSYPLGQFLYDYLDPHGAHYSKVLNWYPNKPGSNHQYSNVGAALAGYLVEAILNSGQSFAEICNERVFQPLGMDNSGWHLADFGSNIEDIALPTVYLDLKHKYKDLCQYGFPDYPNGLLRTSADQLALFLSMFIDLGTLKGARILKEETAAMMRVPQPPLTTIGGAIAPGQALIWYYRVLADRVLLGHSGGEMGVATDMFFNPESGVGFVVLTNGDWSQQHYEKSMENIEAYLMETFDQPWPPAKRDLIVNVQKDLLNNDLNNQVRTAHVGQTESKKRRECEWYPCC